MLKKNKLILIILLLAFFIRLPFINGSFWLDEAAQVLESSRPLAQQYQIPDDFQPPLFHYLVHFELQVTRNEAVLRFVSLFSSLLSILLVYLILCKCLSKKAALLGSLFLAINPFAIFYAQELRPYALATFFACLSWYVLMSQVQRPKNLKVSESGLWFILATVGGLYSMYLYPFIILSQFLYLLIEKRRLMRWLVVCLVVSGLLFLPWLPFFLNQLHAGLSLAGNLPGWSQAVATPQLKALPLTMAKFMVGQVELKDSPFYLILAGIGVLISLWAIICSWRQRSMRFLVYWFLIPIFGAWVISFVVPVIQPKRVMIALPALMAILGVWISGCSRRVFALIICIIFLSTLAIYFLTPKYQREDWKSLVTLIQTQTVGSHSAVVFAFPEAFAPWRWYGNGSALAVPTGTLRVENTSQLDRPFSQLSGENRIFVFDYLRDLSDPSHLVEVWLLTNGFKQTNLIDAGNVGFVRVYDSR